jgi:hypothetical protein
MRPPMTPTNFRLLSNRVLSRHQLVAGWLPRNPDGVLNLLDNYLRLRIADGKAAEYPEVSNWKEG